MSFVILVMLQLWATLCPAAVGVMAMSWVQEVGDNYALTLGTGIIAALSTAVVSYPTADILYAKIYTHLKIG